MLIFLSIVFVVFTLRISWLSRHLTLQRYSKVFTPPNFK
nr:MAG TPA: hypothetical protein [Caudoviricetes sp.]